MGPSGSGKTTLLNLIAGLDRATGGEVIVQRPRPDRPVGVGPDPLAGQQRRVRVPDVQPDPGHVGVRERRATPLADPPLAEADRKQERDDRPPDRRPRRARGPLPPAALRRPGAAGLDRPGDRDRPLPDRGRRADRRPRPQEAPTRSSTSSNSLNREFQQDHRHGHPRPQPPPSGPRGCLHLDKGRLVGDIVQALAIGGRLLKYFALDLPERPPQPRSARC